MKSRVFVICIFLYLDIDNLEAVDEAKKQSCVSVDTKTKQQNLT